MTQFFYTAQHMMRQAGRKSPTAAVQLKPYMPAPEVVMVSGRGAAGWSLSTWRPVAKTRRSPLKEDLLGVIDRLQAEESDLGYKYTK